MVEYKIYLNVLNHESALKVIRLKSGLFLQASLVMNYPQ